MSRKRSSESMLTEEAIREQFAKEGSVSDDDLAMKRLRSVYYYCIMWIGKKVVN